LGERKLYRDTTVSDAGVAELVDARDLKSSGEKITAFLQSAQSQQLTDESIISRKLGCIVLFQLSVLFVLNCTGR